MPFQQQRHVHVADLPCLGNDSLFSPFFCHSVRANDIFPELILFPLKPIQLLLLDSFFVIIRWNCVLEDGMTMKLFALSIVLGTIILRNRVFEF
jgi:hypothetical protein